MKPPPLICWGLARFLSGKTINGELDSVEGRWRRFLDHLAGLPVADRLGAFNAFLKSVPPEDEEEIITAIVNEKPERPPPPPEADDAPGADAGLVRLTCAADITPSEVEWLWSGRIPRGMVTLFAGDPKLGKSFVTLAMAAAESRGAQLPGGIIPDGPGSVIILSAEDDPSRTIVPRLKAAGSDLKRIHLLESVMIPRDSSDPKRTLPPTERFPSLCEDIGVIEAAADRLGDCRLIIFDPVTAYLDGVDDHRNAELRGVLTPLKKLAEHLNVAVVMVSHLSKSGGVNGKHRVIGSIAYVGVSRANFLFVRDRTDLTDRRVLMLDNGGNLAPTAPTLAYVIEDRGDGPRVEWLDEPVAITVDEALAAESAAAAPGNPAKAGERKEAADWLKEMLHQGPVLAKEILESAPKCGIAPRTLRRAKEDMGVESYREGFGKDSKCFWRMPNASADPAE
jgi:hypothetical protein